MRIGFKKVHPDAQLPKYAHPTDTGMDVCAVEDTLLIPGKATIVSTGLIADIPTGYEIQVRSRSGLAAKANIIIANGVGSVDSSYRGVIGVIMKYLPSIEDVDISLDRRLTAEPYVVKKGDRIAQFVVAPVTKCEPVEVTEVSETDRGTGGFGSTGV